MFNRKKIRELEQRVSALSAELMDYRRDQFIYVRNNLPQKLMVKDVVVEILAHLGLNAEKKIREERIVLSGKGGPERAEDA